MSDLPDGDFTLEAWIESVKGETIRFEEPDGLGARQNGFRARDPSICGECEEEVMLVAGERRIPTKCPLCHREIGMLELGTDSVAQWQSYDEEIKNV